jgi:hypothetical protein
LQELNSLQSQLAVIEGLRRPFRIIELAAPIGEKPGAREMNGSAFDGEAAIGFLACELLGYVPEGGPSPGIFAVQLCGIAEPGLVEKISVKDVNRRICQIGGCKKLAIDHIGVEDGWRQALYLETRCFLYQGCQVVQKTFVAETHNVVHVDIQYIGYGASSD